MFDRRAVAHRNSTSITLLAALASDDCVITNLAIFMSSPPSATGDAGHSQRQVATLGRRQRQRASRDRRRAPRRRLPVAPGSRRRPSRRTARRERRSAPRTLGRIGRRARSADEKRRGVRGPTATGDGALEADPMRLAVLNRDDHLDALPDHLLPGVAEHADRAVIEVTDTAVAAGGDRREAGRSSRFAPDHGDLSSRWAPRAGVGSVLAEDTVMVILCFKHTFLSTVRLLSIDGV